MAILEFLPFFALFLFHQEPFPRPRDGWKTFHHTERLPGQRTISIHSEVRKICWANQPLQRNTRRHTYGKQFFISAKSLWSILTAGKEKGGWAGIYSHQSVFPRKVRAKFLVLFRFVRKSLAAAREKKMLRKTKAHTVRPEQDTYFSPAGASVSLLTSWEGFSI